MQKKRGAFSNLLWGGLFCLVLLLTGCSMWSGTGQVEELLRAPRLAGDYGEMQKALNDWLGQSATLKYPQYGELLSPFLMSDWNGDGEQDAAILYTTAQNSNVCLAVLERDEDKKWKVRSTIEGLSDTVESVRFATLREGRGSQILVGYSAPQGDEYLAVYSYEAGEILSILEQPYGQYLVEDITGSGQEDILLMSKPEEIRSIEIMLLTADKDGGFQRVAVTGMSRERFLGCASLAAGTGADGGQYLVLDGWTGVPGTHLASVLLYFNQEKQRIEPARQISMDELYLETLRNISTLTSRDLDGDGIVEIPIQPDNAGRQSLSQSKHIAFIVWMDYTSTEPERSFGILDEEYGYYLALPFSWKGRLGLRDGEEENSIELYDTMTEELLMSLRMVNAAGSSHGWTSLGVLASMRVQARLEQPPEKRPSDYQLRQSLYVL